MARTVTIKDVAGRANVSLATVSRVINQKGNVNPERRQQVIRAIEELNYNPNYAARALVKKRSGSIGIIVHNLHDPFFYDLIRGFEEGAQQTSYNIVFCSVLGGDMTSKEKYIKYLSNGVVDAVVLYGSYLADEAVVKYLTMSPNVNYVMIENDIPTLHCNKMLIDNIQGARSAVEYLIGKGHRNIAHIGGSPAKRVTTDRFNGYLDAMRGARLEVQADCLQYTLKDYRLGYDHMQSLMKAKNRPSAVFCSDDAIASYAVRGAQAMGLRVPEDVSVMGFDNQTILPDHYRGPEITSVEQPLYQIGLDSILLLNQQLGGKHPPTPACKLYPTRIVEKETVCERREPAREEQSYATL